jgi:DNA-binding XRE family transcriptional regulator
MTGNQFYLIRCELGLTQEELAEKMGLHYTSIGKIEKKAKVKKYFELAVRQLQDDFKRNIKLTKGK